MRTVLLGWSPAVAVGQAVTYPRELVLGPPGVGEVHRQQADVNRTLIARADSGGQFRLADNLRRVQDSLDRIIPALEALGDNNTQP